MPSLPKYSSTWDIGLVLKKVESWNKEGPLDLQKLPVKLTVLLALGSAFRVQSLVFIKLENIAVSSISVDIVILDITKTSRPGTLQPHVFFSFFNENPYICIARTLQQYIRETSKVRENDTQLLVSSKRPHKKVGNQTVSRQIKTVLKEAGIDQRHTAHSTGHASTSIQFKKGLDLNIIKNAAGWSVSSK